MHVEHVDRATFLAALNTRNKARNKIDAGHVDGATSVRCVTCGVTFTARSTVKAERHVTVEHGAGRIEMVLR